MKVIDNFLPKDQFNKIKEVLESGYFPWYWNDYSSYVVGDVSQFVHGFISEGKVNSDFFRLFTESDLFIKLNTHGLIKCKANLNYPTKTNIIGAYHTDFCKEECKDVTTSILYINSNNGGTCFEDGTKVDSVSNRVVTFDCSIKHAPVSCTDKLRRIVVNFNYSENKK